MVKVKLLTPRVTIDTSHAAGEEIEVCSDEAIRMVEADLAVYVSGKQPARPKSSKSKKV